VDYLFAMLVMGILDETWGTQVGNRAEEPMREILVSASLILSKNDQMEETWTANMIDICFNGILGKAGVSFVWPAYD
jgi:hypothetical protein